MKKEEKDSLCLRLLNFWNVYGDRTSPHFVNIVELTSVSDSVVQVFSDSIWHCGLTWYRQRYEHSLYICFWNCLFSSSRLHLFYSSVSLLSNFRSRFCVWIWMWVFVLFKCITPESTGSSINMSNFLPLLGYYNHWNHFYEAHAAWRNLTIDSTEKNQRSIKTKYGYGNIE